MGTLPRVAPRTFYDIAIEVALIRPGPIQGHAVNPYIRRRRGEEQVTYLHPLLEPILERTLGVPLFQEQLMEMAVAIAGFSAADADELRQAMAAKRSATRMEKMRAQALRRHGGARRDRRGGRPGLRGAGRLRQLRLPRVALGVVRASRLLLGLVEASLPGSVHRGVVNSQPMGFWSPQSLVADARRHGVGVRRPHVNRSEVGASLEGCERGPAAASRAGVGARGGGGDGGAHRGRGALARRRGPGAPGRGDPGATRDAGRRRRARPRGHRGRGRRRGRREPAAPRRAGAGCCGRPARRRRARPIGCPASWWGPRPRHCPSPASTRRWATTCGRSGWRPSAPPCTWPASDSRPWAC